MFKMSFLNEPNKFVYLTAHQLECVLNGDFINSGLSLDDYMSLKSEKWTRYFS